MIALGRGVFELTGYREQDCSEDVIDAFQLSAEDGKNPASWRGEWGVRGWTEARAPSGTASPRR